MEVRIQTFRKENLNGANCRRRGMPQPLLLLGLRGSGTDTGTSQLGAETGFGTPFLLSKLR